MKRIKIIMLVFAITGGVVVSFSFTSSNTHKPFLNHKIYYVSEEEYQRLEAGHTTETDLLERTVQSPEFVDTANNWQDAAVSFTPICHNQKYIGYIEFTLDIISTDGDDDGALTRKEAVDAVWAKIVATNYSLPTSFFVDADSDGNKAEIILSFASEAH